MEELGFKIGDYISVTCEDGRLVITPDAERASIKAREDEYMEHRGYADVYRRVSGKAG